MPVVSATGTAPLLWISAPSNMDSSRLDGDLGKPWSQKQCLSGISISDPLAERQQHSCDFVALLVKNTWLRRVRASQERRGKGYCERHGLTKQYIGNTPRVVPDIFRSCLKGVEGCHFCRMGRSRTMLCDYDFNVIIASKLE